MSNTSLRSTLLTALLLLLAVLPAAAQSSPAFDKDKLYRIALQHASTMVVEETGPKTAAIRNENVTSRAQLWSVTPLSGSWRLINPESGNAIRIEGNRVELGENNGSDEAQLWKIENGMLVPANRPSVAVNVEMDGSLTLVDKKKAAKMKSTHFSFTDAGIKASDALNDEARRANFWENETIFEQNKELGSATKLPYRS